MVQTSRIIRCTRLLCNVSWPRWAGSRSFCLVFAAVLACLQACPSSRRYTLHPPPTHPHARTHTHLVTPLVSIHPRSECIVLVAACARARVRLVIPGAGASSLDGPGAWWRDAASTGNPIQCNTGSPVIQIRRPPPPCITGCCRRRRPSGARWWCRCIWDPSHAFPTFPARGAGAGRGSCAEYHGRRRADDGWPPHHPSSAMCLRRTSFRA